MTRAQSANIQMHRFMKTHICLFGMIGWLLKCLPATARWRLWVRYHPRGAPARDAYIKSEEVVER